MMNGKTDKTVLEVKFGKGGTAEYVRGWWFGEREHTKRIIEAMGLKMQGTTKLPLGAGIAVVDGFQYTLHESRSVALVARGAVNYRGRPVKVSTHRLYVNCPKCGREIPLGRFHQHYGTATCKREFDRATAAYVADHSHRMTGVAS